MTRETKSGPSRPTRAAETKTIPTTNAANSLPRPRDTPLPTFVDAAALVADAYVMVVTVDDDHHRRRIFLTLGAAERAVERAQARGQVAQVVLCALQPVEGGRL